LAGGKAYAALEPPAGRKSEKVAGGDGESAHDAQAVSKSTREIVKYDVATGERSVLVSVELLTIPGTYTALDIQNYWWSDDGGWLLVFTNTEKVWRQHTRGDYYAVNLSGTGSIKKVGGDADPSCLMYAKFSPGDGGRVGYIYHNNVFVQDLSSMVVTQLTFDGLPGHGGMADVINGNFDWVYEEEFSIQDGWRWSPDGKRIAYWQLQTADVQWYKLYDTITDAPYAKVTPYPYPKVGTKNPRARIGVVSASCTQPGQQPAGTVWMQLEPASGEEHYIARMEWAAGSDELVVQRLPRAQNVIDILIVNATSGAANIVHSESDECWLDVTDNLNWVDGGNKFTWLSERSGYRHLYLISRDGSSVQDVTEELAQADVVSVVRVDDASGYVYFIAAPSTPLERYLYRAPLSRSQGAGGMERITPDDMASSPTVGVHQYDISPDGAAFAVHTYSSFGVPPTINIISLPDHAVVTYCVDNAELKAKLASIARGPHEFFKIETGSKEVPGVSSELDGCAIFPPGFDKDSAKDKTYPLLVYVYGEPAACTVMNSMGSYQYNWHLLMAQRGYIVVSFDSRGTPAPKGRAWRKAAYKKIGITANNDQAAAVSALLKRWSFLDDAKVGIWGWSGGGSSTLQAMFRFPEVYTAGAAIAFVADQRFYDTVYQERYMGVPPLEKTSQVTSGKPEGDDEDGWKHYIEGSPITHVGGLEGPLLLAYGTGDDNCHYQNMEALTHELVTQDKYFEMLSYPNRTHSIENARGPNTRKHLFESMTRFFLRSIAPPSELNASGSKL
jgi:dipeptidyl-peptidase-4